ncbi:MAG: hypothetical protein NZ988_03290 [Thaumarchaeota archaeon]|nr:hypothetical protein [Candidatus Calditenuaceae archaeon]MDW8187056.1 hypothetical protein [Nitrososphaerota archaeon]
MREVQDIRIDNVETEGKVSLFRGKANVSGFEVTFNGIAVYTIGGPTVGIELDEDSKVRLTQSGLSEAELDDLLGELQRLIVEGDLILSGEKRVRGQPL